MARTVRILHTLLSLISKHLKCDKFEVNTHSVAYLAGRNPSAEVTLGWTDCWTGSGDVCWLLWTHSALFPAALLTVSEEVRSRCSLKHRKSLLISDLSMDPVPMETYSSHITDPSCR